MTIDKDIEARILRYHFVEKWRTGTIATQLGIHHTVVDRVLSQAGLPKVERTQRDSIFTPYIPFILATLAQYPTLTAARLFEMAKHRGYPGRESHFRHRISELRPRQQPEAYLRLKTLPGEQAQVDWGHFGHIQIGQAKRTLMAYVMVLSWSRQIFLRFYLNQQTASFLRGQVAAFEAFNGVPKVCLFDNMKTAVLERQGSAIRFHPELLALSSHYHFEPRAAAPARGNEKGRVERAIRYIRDNFFAGRHYTSLEDLNEQAHAWCMGVSADRRCPEDPQITVREAFAQEQASLLPLPDNPFDTREQVNARVQKTPYVRFDGNQYSVPHQHVQTAVTISACLNEVRILSQSEVIATHPRSFSKGEQVENEAHINALWLAKTNAQQHRGQDRLCRLSSHAQPLLQQIIARGHPIKGAVNRLNQLLDDYGALALHEAMGEAIERQAPTVEGVEQILTCRRESRQQPPPIAVHVPDKVKHYQVKPTNLSIYDGLGYAQDDNYE
ncbi:MAG: IS21 family transposase [Nitrincola sp.]|nr:IS21 family transposase [Nitrincola sp.]